MTIKDENIIIIFQLAAEVFHLSEMLLTVIVQEGLHRQLKKAGNRVGIWNPKQHFN
jgi:hypothetical protein